MRRQQITYHHTALEQNFEIIQYFDPISLICVSFQTCYSLSDIKK